MISIFVQFMKFKRARESYMEAQIYYLDFKACDIDFYSRRFHVKHLLVVSYELCEIY